MEHLLRCNSLKCRKGLTDKALVTTCSHIFCIDCAVRLGLTKDVRDQERKCPACATQLFNPDDAVIATLNPSEDYKTSVLSGLDPNTIIECASRALSFWAYQTMQEIVYHEHLGKALTDKYSSLNIELDKIINSANSEISKLQNTVDSVKSDQETLQRRNEELTKAFQEKSRRLLQTQELYDKLKRKALLGQMQDAAEEAVDSTLHIPPAMADIPVREMENPPASLIPEPAVSYQQHLNDSARLAANSRYHPPTTQAAPWLRTVGGAHVDVPITPSTHRQRLGDPTALRTPTAQGPLLGSPRNGQNRPSPPAALRGLSSLGHRSTPRFPSIGLTSGLKAGQPAIHRVGDFTFPADGFRARQYQGNRPAPSAPFGATHFGQQ